MRKFQLKVSSFVSSNCFDLIDHTQIIFTTSSNYVSGREFDYHNTRVYFMQTIHMKTFHVTSSNIVSTLIHFCFGAILFIIIAFDIKIGLLDESFGFKTQLWQLVITVLQLGLWLPCFKHNFCCVCLILHMSSR